MNFLYEIKRPFLIAWLMLAICTANLYGNDGERNSKADDVELAVLGTAQDAGYPQADCQKACCKAAWQQPELRRWVSCVAVVDHQSNERFIFDCTPDFRSQWQWLQKNMPSRSESGDKIHGIFLTHAHIGHYTGLMHLGREAMGAREVPVYVMPRMKTFLTDNGPWSQLVSLKNIQLRDVHLDQPLHVNERISVTPLLVPHRDEYSETVGFIIEGPNKKVLFLPDIDKWSRWDRSIEKVIASVDIAYLDGTFLSNGELPGRDMSLIPHPFIEESIKLFSALDETEREKVRFIHLNHTNPAIREGSPAEKQVFRSGLRIARQGEKVKL